MIIATAGGSVDHSSQLHVLLIPPNQLQVLRDLWTITESLAGLQCLTSSHCTCIQILTLMLWCLSDIFLTYVNFPSGLSLNYTVSLPFSARHHVGGRLLPLTDPLNSQFVSNVRNRLALILFLPFSRTYLLCVRLSNLYSILFFKTCYCPAGDHSHAWKGGSPFSGRAPCTPERGKEETRSTQSGSVTPL